MTRGTTFNALLLVLALMLAGCGGDDTGGGESGGGESGSADTGSETTDAGSEPVIVVGDPDEDFPIPIPDGLLLDAHADAGISISSQRALFYENGDFDRIVAFYDDWTSDNGEWSRTEAAGSVAYQRLDTETLWSIVVTPDHDPGAQADGPVTTVQLLAA